MSSEITFFAPGVPVPQGSLRSFQHARTGKVVTPQSPRVVEWRAVVHHEAMKASADRLPFGRDVPVRLWLDFYLPRPKLHYRTNGTLKPNAPPYPLRFDLDKLTRAVMDALTGALFVDDAQVTEIIAHRDWTREPSDSRSTGDGVRVLCDRVLYFEWKDGRPKAEPPRAQRSSMTRELLVP